MNDDKLLDVYLAGPYTFNHKDHNHRRWIEAQRFRQLTEVAAHIVYQGLMVYSPITHSHPMTEYALLPGTWEYWKKLDIIMIAACREMWVYKLPEWEQSVGVAAEISMAREMGKGVFLIEPYPGMVQSEIDAYKSSRMGL